LKIFGDMKKSLGERKKEKTLQEKGKEKILAVSRPEKERETVEQGKKGGELVGTCSKK